jgi:hypothetical protein
MLKLNHLDEEIINQAKEKVKKDKELAEDVKKDFNFKDYTKKDLFFQYISKNIIPEGTYRNVKLFKNIAVALVKQGLSNKEIEKIMKPIIKKNFPNKNYNELRGWVDKVRKGEIDSYNIYEINNWSKRFLGIEFYQTIIPLNTYLEGFIFDEEKILQTKPFCMHLLKNNEKELLAYGIKLPREEEIKDSKGNILGKEQIWRPIIVKSDNTFNIITKQFKEEYKTNYEDISEESKLNWRLKSIKDYLENKSDIINGKELIGKIVNLYKKFCYFRDEEWYYIHSLWDIGTYLFMLFPYYPLFELRGMTGTAKTKVMILSSSITFNSMGVMVNPSASTLFRLTNDLRPTKYIDEVENLYPYNKSSGQYEMDERVQLINESYYKGGKVPRQEKFGNKFKTIFYSCYSPTMLGGIRGLIGATETRAITHIMTKNPKSDDRGDLDIEEENEEEFKNIRDELYLFGLQNWDKILGLKKSIDYNKIKGRNKQLWQPLLMIAKHIDEQLYLRIKKFAEDISKQKTLDIISEGTLDFNILEVVKEILKEREILNPNDNRIYIQEIKQKLRFLGEYGNKTISSHLDRLGFKKFRDRDTNKGSYFELTEDIFRQIIEPICESLFKSEKEVKK